MTPLALVYPSPPVPPAALIAALALAAFLAAFGVEFALAVWQRGKAGQ